MANNLIMADELKVVEEIKSFKNKNFKKRDYETTNIIFCQAEKAPNDNWIECSEDDINCPQLWIKAGVKYFGHL